MTQAVMYNEKKYVLPFAVDLNLDAKDKLINVANPFSGNSVELPWFAVAVYDAIKGAELIENYEVMRKGLDWFQENFTDEYYTLLD